MCTQIFDSLLLETESVRVRSQKPINLFLTNKNHTFFLHHTNQLEFVEKESRLLTDNMYAGDEPKQKNTSAKDIEQNKIVKG